MCCPIVLGFDRERAACPAVAVGTAAAGVRVTPTSRLGCELERRAMVEEKGAVVVVGVVRWAVTGLGTGAGGLRVMG